MEKTMIPQPIIAQTKPFVYGLCFVLAASALYLCFQKSRTSKRGKRKGSRLLLSQKALSKGSSADDSHASNLSEFKKIFMDKVEAFRKDMLAYQLERLVWRNDLPVDTIEKIRADYGKVLLQPSLFVYEELKRHHLLEEDLVAIEREWLQKRGYPVPEDKLKEELEQRIFDEEHQKAIQTVKELMPDGQSFVDFV